MAILFFFLFQVKIWFQNHRYKCKRQAKEKAMAEQNQHNQVNYNFIPFIGTTYVCYTKNTLTTPQINNSALSNFYSPPALRVGSPFRF